jgi:hypothetical protein
MTNQEKQITDEFMKDFEDLLRRYNAMFSVTEETHDPDFCEWNVPIAEITFNEVFDDERYLIKPYINFRLPDFINPNTQNTDGLSTQF